MSIHRATEPDTVPSASGRRAQSSTSPDLAIRSPVMLWFVTTPLFLPPPRSLQTLGNEELSIVALFLIPRPTPGPSSLTVQMISGFLRCYGVGLVREVGFRARL